MTINWEQETAFFKDDLIKDLVALLKIDSQRDIEHKTADFPLGPGPAKALNQVLAYAKRDGFATKNIKNVAGRIEFGAGTTTLGVLAHVDVVPAGDGWQTDPFEPVIKDGAIYARGTSDDKGPLLAAYYGLKVLKKLGIEPKQQIHFIIGTDEESEWLGVHEYFKTEPKPDWGFSPDAEFPIINGEKGIVSFQLDQHFTSETATDFTLQQFKSGIRDNMVPHAATAIIAHHQDATFETAFNTYLTTNQLTGSQKFANGHYTLQLHGKGAHAATPQAGRNGATFLINFLKDYAFDANGATYLALGATLHEDIYGKNIKIAYQDSLMGPLTVSASIFNYDFEAKSGQIILNIRYPKGIDIEAIKAQFEQNWQAQYAISIKPHYEIPHYVPGDDPLVKTLLATYEAHTGQAGTEGIVGGGTYGRILERGVAFGAQFPGAADVMHQPNEFMKIDDILKASAIYADAIYRLTL
ncbi:dipeptidase PepV [Agrilactobacillus composti DSM 18527 = JCM 14202]|uniref:Dipeptidase PepV n=1 Tax=Agrilactobacillus composti DSM 18527 = JCM 14202 TaxID=1423734 RepID=X0PIT8_9LACO|nr:dipeptidase PepV [Agrilactobacillus composti]KRM34773.1 dipeptidase PepV [Agrilactobacillus composti DSM 18527 = JCM 14202]GAF42043.1 acetylornithine deacetylase/succinyl-diaminopimelate desuccinylase [Agrilactobacillus composti DSM 18527 = JCM 14202]